MLLNKEAQFISASGHNALLCNLIGSKYGSRWQHHAYRRCRSSSLSLTGGVHKFALLMFVYCIQKSSRIKYRSLVVKIIAYLL